MLPKTASVFAILAVIQLFSPAVHSANILFYFGLSGHSHISSIWPVIRELAERGHNVTMLTSMVPKSSHPKVTAVHVVDLYNVFKDTWDEGGDLLRDRFTGRHRELMYANDAIDLALRTCEVLFESPVAHSLIYDSQFDLVIMDTAFNDCAFGLAYYHYKCPFILYSAVSVFPTYFDDLGLQVESSSMPDMEIGNGPPKSFLDRLIATWQPIRWMYKRRTEFYPVLSKLFQERLHLNDTPNFLEVYTKTSLVFLNTHYSNDYARSLPPLFVSIGGIGIQHERKPLPTDLEEFIMKPGSKGFIYVSFGTAVRISKSNAALRRKFFATFANMSDYQFVWKWEEDIPDKNESPPNVYFAKWMPQQDLLAHKSIKGYIAHGGMNGVNEAVNYGVPMVIFPVMGDQDYNGNAVAAKDMAIVLEITDFTQKELSDSLHKIVNDKELRSRVARASTVFRDRPMKPLDTAVWWIEYVLRHEDTSFLMPLAVHQSWYQRRLLDVWFFVFAISAVIFLAGAFMIVKLLQALLNQASESRHRPQSSRRHKVKAN